MAEAEDLKSSQCGFDPHSGHHLFIRIFNKLYLKSCKSNFAVVSMCGIVKAQMITKIVQSKPVSK